MDVSPVEPGGCYSPSRVSVSISPVKSAGICEGFPEAESGLLSPASQRLLYPHRVLVGAYPQQFLEWIGCERGSSQQGLPYSQQQLFPSRVELER